MQEHYEKEAVDLLKEMGIRTCYTRMEPREYLFYYTLDRNDKKIIPCFGKLRVNKESALIILASESGQQRN